MFIQKDCSQLFLVLARLYDMKTDTIIMKSKKIEQVNEALFILRHFINLSARLLPFLDELSKKEIPTEEEITDRNKIIGVYVNYTFDTQTSEILMDSEILDKIRTCFRSIIQQSENSSETLSAFLQEHKRLRKKWKYIDAN